MQKTFNTGAKNIAARAGRVVCSVLLVCLGLFAGTYHAGAATFTASLDRDAVTLGESATLSLSCGGGQPQTEPVPPEIANLQIVYVGPSSQFSVINGQVSSSITYNFTVSPKQVGDFTIPPIAIEVGGQKLVSQPLQLKVLKPSAPPPGAANAGSQVAFLKLILPKTNLYVGEMVAAQLQLYLSSRVQNIGNFQITAFPADGFNVGKTVQGQQRQMRVGNAIYTVIPLNLALTAIKAGSYTLGPVTASVIVEVAAPNRQRDQFFDQFFGFGGERRQVALATETEAVQLLAVPRQNMPPDFHGAIGSFTMTVNAGPTNLTEGDPITVKIQIAGRGSIDSIALPELAWPNFKVHPPETKVETTDQLGLQGTKTFEQIVTPENADVKALPPVSFSFFDPEQKTFRTLTQPALPLVVRPGGAAPVPSVYAAGRSKQKSPPLVQDIVPNKQRLGTVAQVAPPLIQQPWFVAVQGVPMLAFLSAVVWRRRSDQLANNPRLRRQRHIAQVVREGLAELRQFAAQNNSDEFFAAVFRLLQEQLGAALDLPTSAITEAVVDERLRPRGVAESTLVGLQELFQTCNLARYAPIKSSQELAAIIPKLEGVLAELARLNL